MLGWHVDEGRDSTDRGARMRIVTRSGPYLAAFPLSVEELGDCRICREHREVTDQAVRAVHEGRSLDALKIASEWEKQIEGHSCKKWKDMALMAPRRGRWLSVRAEIGIYAPDLRADGFVYRLPIARADIEALGPTYETPTGFRVVSTPNLPSGGELDLHEGRVCQWLLSGLDADERAHLVADLKEV